MCHGANKSVSDGLCFLVMALHNTGVRTFLSFGGAVPRLV